MVLLYLQCCFCTFLIHLPTSSPRSKKNLFHFYFCIVVSICNYLAYFNTNGSPVAGSLQLSTKQKLVPPFTASVSDTLEFSQSLLCQYTRIACELTVTAEAHWNYPPQPLSVAISYLILLIMPSLPFDKLNETNYNDWKIQMEALLEEKGLFGVMSGHSIMPTTGPNSKPFWRSNISPAPKSSSPWNLSSSHMLEMRKS